MTTDAILSSGLTLLGVAVTYRSFQSWRRYRDTRLLIIALSMMGTTVILALVALECLLEGV